jgi:ethanolamine utilization protein EutM
MQYALGLVETKGLVGAIEAADAMVKAAEVSILNRELVEGGIVIVKVYGEVGAVRAAVSAGATAAGRVGHLLGSHIIPRPDNQIDGILVDENTVSINSSGLEAMTVTQLRQHVRTLGDTFPLQGREISRANKQQLLAAIAQFEQS